MRTVTWRLLAFLLVVNSAAHASDGTAFTLAYDSFAPFIWAEDGAARGLYVDVLNEALAQRLNIPVEFEQVPWKRAQRSVRVGETDGMVTLPTTARLAYSQASSVALVKVCLGVFTRVGHPCLKAMEQMEKPADLMEFSVLTYLGDGWAENRLRGHEVEFGANDLRQVLRKLTFGRGDVFVQTVPTTLYVIEQMGLQGDVVRVPGVCLDRLAFRLLIGDQSSFQGRLPDINRALREMVEDGTMSAIRERYNNGPGAQR